MRPFPGVTILLFLCLSPSGEAASEGTEARLSSLEVWSPMVVQVKHSRFPTVYNLLVSLRSPFLSMGAQSHKRLETSDTMVPVRHSVSIDLQGGDIISGELIIDSSSSSNAHDVKSLMLSISSQGDGLFYKR